MAKIEREFAVGGPCTNCGLVRFESNGERLLRSVTPGWTTPCRWCESWRANDDELWPTPSELPASASRRSLVLMLEGRAAMLDKSTPEGASLYSDLMEAADVICKLSANEQAFMTQVDALNAVLVTYDRWDMRLTLVDNVRRVCQALPPETQECTCGMMAMCDGGGDCPNPLGGMTLSGEALAAALFAMAAEQDRLPADDPDESDPDESDGDEDCSCGLAGCPQCGETPMPGDDRYLGSVAADAARVGMTVDEYRSALKAKRDRLAKGEEAP